MLTYHPTRTVSLLLLEEFSDCLADTFTKMKHLAAFLLLSLNGSSPSQKDVKKLLNSVGIEADEERLSKLFSEIEGKDINEACPILPDRIANLVCS